MPATRKGRFMMLTKHKIAAAAAALTMALGCSAMTASAYTADDVAAKAREAGWPEYLIQMGYNEWNSGEYDQSALDSAYGSVSTYNDDMRKAAANALGVDPDDLPAAPAPTEAPQTTEAAQQNADGTTAPAGQAAAETTTQTTKQDGNPELIVKKADGTEEQRISKADFINMTLEEKQEYVNSLAPESQGEFVASLSNAERNSLIKQLPVDEKAALLQTYIDTAGTMGLDVTVDSLTNDTISLTMRNEEGTVVGMTNVGVTIDETGISHTKQFLIALIGTIGSLAGFGILARRMREE